MPATDHDTTQAAFHREHFAAQVFESRFYAEVFKENIVTANEVVDAAVGVELKYNNECDGQQKDQQQHVFEVAVHDRYRQISLFSMNQC